MRARELHSLRIMGRIQSLTPVLVAVATVATMMMNPRRASADAEPSPPAEHSEPSPPPSSVRALALSIALPLAGYGLMAAAASRDVDTLSKLGMGTGAVLALLGSSGGHVYTGRFGRAAAFSAGRVALAVVGLGAAVEGISYGDSSESDYDHDKARAYMALALGAAGGILGLSVWESVDTYRSARAAEAAGRAGASLAIAPMLVPDRRSLTLGGLALAGTF